MRATNPLEERLIEMIEPVAAELGLRLVRVRLQGLKRKTLQVMAERRADGLMAVEDCEALSRALSPLLDAEDPIKAEYTLEVSSPGIDRPMVALEDFTRFVGHEVKLETAQMLDGRKRFKGAILGVAGEAVRVKLPEGEFEVPFALLHEARLVLTDKLIEEDFKRHAAAQKAQEEAGKAEAQAAKQAKKRKPT